MNIHCNNCDFLFDTSMSQPYGVCPNCHQEQAPEITGSFIDVFELAALLGSGNNGEVFLARHEFLHNEVALKLLNRDQENDKAAVTRFFRESRAAARLNHPNIVQAVAAGKTHSGRRFFAMELVLGEAIDARLWRLGTPYYGEVLLIAAKIADALNYAWQCCKFIHGDIKPGNIIIMESNGEPKLVDLGLARFYGEEFDGELMATPLYAPPEVIRWEIGKIDFRSDMYSFGAMLYELFSGTPPFPGSDPEKVYQAQLNEIAVSLKDRGCLREGLSDLIDQMLAKNPEDRPVSWAIVADMLRTYRLEILS